MVTRREFVTCSACTAMLFSGGSIVAEENALGAVVSPERTRKVYRQSPIARIKKVIRREDTLLRLGGNGDNWHMTWARDDRQLVALCDGLGWDDDPRNLYNTRLFSISGTPNGAKFLDVPGFPSIVYRERINHGGGVGYYGFGTLALDGTIYQFLSTFSRSIMRPEAGPLRFVGAKLIYSTDNGFSWRNQDGSKPVILEDPNQRSRDNMVFLEEDGQAFSLLTILQMGRDYELNRDGYVYVYAPNGNDEGRMNELVMFRVAKNQLRNRKAYQYFAGHTVDGRVRWTPDIEARGVVHKFPSGWVNSLEHPYAWHPSIVFNARLGLYLMANWGMGTAADGMWFEKPSYLGLWAAIQPWGPWIQIHEETAWLPDGDQAARAYQPQIAPKWIAQDGRSFWLVWTDFQHSTEFLPAFSAAWDARNHGEFLRLLKESQRYRPHYAFNSQRVDLVVS